jgi:cysteinyl-tRNA synthetase
MDGGTLTTLASRQVSDTVDLRRAAGNSLPGEHWLYQLQNAALRKIKRTEFDLLTLDYSRDGSETQRYPRNQLKVLQRNGKTTLAYLSIGEAEENRYYFQSHWVSNDPLTGLSQPNENAPDWLGQTNPDWFGNYKVQYWQPDWQTIVFSYLDKIIDSGFDGVYLDIVDGFEYWSDPTNGENLALSETDAAERMINFVEAIAHYAREIRNQDTFFVVPQNGEDILRFDQDGSYLNTISGIAVEDLFFDEQNLQRRSQIRYRLKWLKQAQRHDKTILVSDYVDDGSGYEGRNLALIERFRSAAIARGFLPYVAHQDRELDRLNLIPDIQP